MKRVKGRGKERKLHKEYVRMIERERGREWGKAIEKEKVNKGTGREEENALNKAIKKEKVKQGDKDWEWHIVGMVWITFWSERERETERKREIKERQKESVDKTNKESERYI